MVRHSTTRDWPEGESSGDARGTVRVVTRIDSKYNFTYIYRQQLMRPMGFLSEKPSQLVDRHVPREPLCGVVEADRHEPVHDIIAGPGEGEWKYALRHVVLRFQSDRPSAGFGPGQAGPASRGFMMLHCEHAAL